LRNCINRTGADGADFADTLGRLDLIPHRGTRSAQSAMDRRPVPLLIAGLTFFPKPLSWLRETPV